MSSQFQNRLVGTVVLVALGVIFLPDLLDGKKDKVQEEFAEIPLRPESRVVSTPEESLNVEKLAPLDIGPTSDTPDDDVPKSDTSSSGLDAASGSEGQTAKADVKQEPEAKHEAEQEVKQEVKPEAKPHSKPELKKEPKSEPKAALEAAWTLQLGAFSNAKNVEALVIKLRKAGFKAYTLPSKPVDGSLTKVFVGPDVSQAKIERLRTEVKALTQLDGKVIAYNPLER